MAMGTGAVCGVFENAHCSIMLKAAWVMSSLWQQYNTLYVQQLTALQDSQATAC